MTAILGISAFYHDSAAALVVDGELVAAAQEERFSREKHDSSFPSKAIESCLDLAGLKPSQIDHIGFYEKPLLKFDRLLETYLQFAPSGFRSFRKAMPEWAGPKLQLRREIRRGLGNEYSGRICFCEHHQSHAASAFYPSPFQDAAILTMDGVGEWATSSIGVGHGNQIELTHEVRFPDSIGLLYSAVTYFTGFRVNSGEYKLMGLAPYGEPRYVDVIRDKLIKIYDDGSYRLDQDYFQYCQGLTMTSSRFHQLFNRGPRRADQPIETLDMDLAASVQVVVEEVLLRTARHLHDQTGMSSLCMAGGVALNCVANGRLLREGPFKEIWIQPAAGDAGGAMGVALLMWHQLMGNPRTVNRPDSLSGSLLGPDVRGPDILELDLEERLTQLSAIYTRHDDEDDLCEELAKHLDEGKSIGVARGRMEFGPRALGNRSILADARSPDMQSKLNLKTKFRESFRPFGPMVLAEHAHELFQVDPQHESPYMLLVSPVQESICISTPDPVSESGRGLDRVHQVRSSLPAITHVDYSARLQTVDAIRNPPLRRLLDRFYLRSGCPVLINTSFNVRDEPIVCDWLDALICFMKTDLDVLVLDNLVLMKEEQDGLNIDRLNEMREDAKASPGSDREALWFVLSLSLCLCMVSLILYRQFQSPVVTGALVFAAIGIAIAALLSSRSRRPIQSGFETLTYPVRLVVTYAALGMVYYGLVTPIGLLRRSRGENMRSGPEGETSTWRVRGPRDLASYFRTY